MSWICKTEIKDKNEDILFTKGSIYLEIDDRSESEDIAITLFSDNNRKIYLIDKMVHNHFIEQICI